MESKNKSSKVLGIISRNVVYIIVVLYHELNTIHQFEDLSYESILMCMS